MQPESKADKLYRQFTIALVFYIAGCVAYDRGHETVFLMVCVMGAAVVIELFADWILLCVDRWYAAKRLFARFRSKPEGSP